MPQLKFLVFGLLGACASGSVNRSASDSSSLPSVGGKEAVLVIYLSDVHSQLRSDDKGRGGFARLKKWIDTERAQVGPKTDVVVIGGGDLYGKGSLPCQETKDKECAPFFKDLGLNYATLGNYELYNPASELKTLNESTGATFIGMNVSPIKGVASWSQSPLKYKGRKSGLEFWLASWTSPFDVKDYNVRAFPSASDWMAWKRQWDAPVLFVTHQQLDRDLGFLKDACLSLQPQVQVLALLKANDHRTMQSDSTQCAPLLEPGAFGRSALKLLITKDSADPKRLQVASQFVEISGMAEDEDVKKRIDALYQRLAPNADQVLFTAESEISREALAKWAAEAYHKRLKAEAAITNLGFVKNPIEAGPVTREEFFLALPYKNELMGLDWPVADLQDALCSVAKRKKNGDLDWGSELSFSGFALEGAGTPQCRVVSNKKSLKIVVDQYVVSQSERWLGRNIASRVFRFGVDSRRAVSLYVDIVKPSEKKE